MNKTHISHTVLILSICFLLFAISIYIHKVYADTGNNGKTFVSIVTSKVCQKTSTCPTYKQLADLFDNSNRYVSGDFIFDNHTKSWKRDKPLYQNDFEIYKYGAIDVVVFVDPSEKTQQQSKTIYIESSMSTYIDRGAKGNVTPKQFSDLINTQNELESERLGKKYTLQNEESLLTSYKNKMEIIKSTLEQKKQYYEQLTANGAESTSEIAQQKNAEKDYNNYITESNNAINQYNVQQKKIDSLKSEIDSIQARYSNNIRLMKEKTGNDSFLVTNNTVSYGANRVINGCNDAIIGWQPYGARLLADTLDYFRHNCNVKSSDASLNDLTKISIYKEPTIFTDCGKWCEYMKWLTHAKTQGKELHLDLDKPWQRNGTK